MPDAKHIAMCAYSSYPSIPVQKHMDVWVMATYYDINGTWYNKLHQMTQSLKDFAQVRTSQPLQPPNLHRFQV